MSYYELFCNIKRKLENIKSLSDIVNIEKLIDYMNYEETKMILEENNSDLPFWERRENSNVWSNNFSWWDNQKYYDKCKGKLKEKLNEISKKHLALVKLV